MKRFANLFSIVRVNALACCGAAVLLSACGGTNEPAPVQPLEATAAEVSRGADDTGLVDGMVVEAPVPDTVAAQAQPVQPATAPAAPAEAPAQSGAAAASANGEAKAGAVALVPADAKTTAGPGEPDAAPRVLSLESYAASLRAPGDETGSAADAPSRPAAGKGRQLALNAANSSARYPD